VMTFVGVTAPYPRIPAPPNHHSSSFYHLSIYNEPGHPLQTQRRQADSCSCLGVSLSLAVKNGADVIEMELEDYPILVRRLLIWESST